eukprot:1938736-Amphidinium_carterae.1
MAKGQNPAAKLATQSNSTVAARPEKSATTFGGVRNHEYQESTSCGASSAVVMDVTVVRILSVMGRSCSFKPCFSLQSCSYVLSRA